MHRTLRFPSAGLLIALTFGCSARGGGGGLVDPDAASRVDSATTSDATSKMDSGSPPSDSGELPQDAGPVNDLVSPPDDRGAPPVDLGTPPRCGDGLCNGTENCMTCASDCGACPPMCGDGTCSGTESCTSCPPDCGACPTRCGDGSCNGTETCTTCSTDCGACPPRCGDGACNGGETCTSCSTDCGACPANCGSLTNCAACAADTRCGWCTFEGACQPGNNAGPSVSSFCPTLGNWIRSASSCTAPDAGMADVGTVNIFAACTDTSPGVGSDCGWRTGATYTCTPGAAITVGCTGTTAADAAVCATRLGSCSGDPMIRACAAAGCTYARRVAPGSATTMTPDDDACGTCPLARYLCPSSGQLIVYTRPYNYGGSYTCTLGRS